MVVTSHFTKMAETIHEAQTQEEATVQDLLDQWQMGGHGYVPDKKGYDTIRLRCENVNGLRACSTRPSQNRRNSLVLNGWRLYPQTWHKFLDGTRQLLLR
jgi:hypothetical protein